MKRILLLTLVFATACKDGGTEPTPDPVQVVTTSLPDGTVGASYNVALSASGGTGSYGWSASAGSLPAGLTLSAAGLISGTPSSPGQASFTVRATSGTQSGTRDQSISIQAPEVVITTATLAGGTAGGLQSDAGGHWRHGHVNLGGGQWRAAGRPHALERGRDQRHADGGWHQQLHGAGVERGPDSHQVAEHRDRLPGGYRHDRHAAGRHGWYRL
jgi:hypothetical protein